MSVDSKGRHGIFLFGTYYSSITEVRERLTATIKSIPALKTANHRDILNPEAPQFW
jgi:hypothetical protein